MRWAIVAAWSLTTALLTGQVPPSGGERHTPDGTFCTPAGVATGDMHVIDPTHPCHCAHMTHSKDCEGPVQENSKCSNYCSKQKCRCPVTCDPHDPEPQPDPEDQ